MSPESVICWHFADSTYRDGSPLLPAGVELPALGGSKPCERGMYHGSVRAIDALKFAPGSMVARVRIWDHLVDHGNPVDKVAGRRRVGITDYIDATPALRDFSRWCPRSVLQHYPGTPDPAVIEWLYTGNEELRGAAESAARSAAWSAPWSAARSAAWSAPWSAAESAARSAAESAAESAARSAAESAAESAARSAAESAAGSAAWSAAWPAAWPAAESAAESAARSRQNIVLDNLLCDAMGISVEEMA